MRKAPLIRQGGGPDELERVYENLWEKQRDVERMIALANATEDVQDQRRRGLVRGRSAAGDEDRLRMLPVHAPGVAGVIPGSRPDDTIEDLDRAGVRPTMQTGFYAGGRHKRALTQMLRQRDGDVCYLCHADLNQLRVVIEHIVPTSHGGSDDPSNLALACFHCNSRKGDRFVSFLIRTREPIFDRQ